MIIEKDWQLCAAKGRLGFLGVSKGNPWNTIRPKTFGAALIKYNPAMQAEVTAGIEAAWNLAVPDFPIIRSSLDEAFEKVFSIFTGINRALIGFSLMALLIAWVTVAGHAFSVAKNHSLNALSYE